MLARLRRGLDAAGLGAGAGRFSPPRVMVETTDFGADPGHLRMLSHVPEGLGRGAPLVVTLHGCGQGAEDYARQSGWLTLAERRGFAVLAPAQSSANNPNRCFNWFERGDIARGEGESASIAAMIGHLLAEERLDASRVYVTGLSAGGAMTLVMLAAYPDLFAGGAVIAGLPYGVAGGIAEAIRVMHGADHRSSAALAALLPTTARTARHPPRLAIWHGTSDAVVAPANATDIARQWALAHGLPETPDGATSDGQLSRRVWRSRDRGAVAIELNLIKGLGHGAPLATLGPDGLGDTAPYMLEAGVSSTTEIADFWGLKTLRHRAAETAARPAAAALQPPRPDPAAERSDTLGAQVMAKVADHVPASVRDVIAKALRGAGLMN